MEEHERISNEAVRAYNARDVEGLVAITHPEVVLELVGGFADLVGPRFEGHEGVRSFYSDWFSAFDSLAVELEENRTAGDRLVALTKVTATARGADRPVEMRSAVVYAFRDGLVDRVGLYYDRARALADAGLTSGGD